MVSMFVGCNLETLHSNGGRDVCVHIINILIILNAKAIIHCTGVLYLGPQNNNRDTHKHQYFTNLLTLKCE